MHAGLRHLLLSGVNPVADLNFAGGVLQLGGARYSNPAEIPGWSFTRASEGYALNSAGVLVPFASGVPRVTDLGILVEEARTNLALQSQTFTSGTWLKDTGVTIGATNLTAPDLTASASQVTYSGGAAGFSLYQRPAISTATQYTQTIWVKSATGSNQTFRLVYDNATRTTNQTATTQWQRFTVSFTSTVTSAYLGVDGPGSYDLIVWGAQIEAGSFATSPIATAGSAVTRAADNVGLSSIPEAYNTAEGTWLADVIRSAGQTATGVILIGTSGAPGMADRDPTNASGSLNLTTYTAVAASPLTQGVRQKLAYAFKAGDHAISLNGAIATNANATAISRPTAIFIGRSSSNTAYFNGYIGRILMQPTRQPNAQLQGITA